MSDLRLVGSVAIKVRPDTSDFKEETQKGINRELGPQGDKAKGKAKVEVELDTTKAKNKMRTLEQEMEGKAFKVNVGLDYDSVQRAKQQIDRALDSLKNKVIDFEMNEPSLRAAQAKIRELEKTVRVKMEFNRDEAGYQSILNKIQNIRRQKALVPISFHTDEKSLREAERKAEEAIARIKANETIDIRYSDNYDGMKQAIGELDSRLEDIRKLRITTKLDEASLEASRAEMLEMMQFADVTVKFNEDKKGYETVLSRIRAIQREKLEKEITFSTDEESLKREAEKYEKLIEDAAERAAIAAMFEPVVVEYNEDLAGYASVLKHLKKIQQEKLVKKITFNTDEESLAAEIEKFEQLVDDITPKQQIEFEVITDRGSIEKALAQIDAAIDKNWEVKIPVDADTASLRRLRAQLQHELDELRHPFGTNKMIFQAELDRKSVDHAEHEAKKLKDKIDDMKASMEVQLAGSLLVASQLNYLGRDRVVSYIARVNMASVAVAEGVLKSIGGINLLSSLGKQVEGLFTKFDTLSMKTVALATALGNLANVGVYAGTAIFKIGEGVFQSLGLLAAAPAVLGAATVGYTIFTAAFNNFFDAFNKDPKIAESALAALPPLARKTVDSITGLYKGLANPIQERFWERVGSTLSDSIETLYPKLKSSLLDSTDAVGDFVAGFGRSMNKLALGPGLDDMFKGFKGFFVNLSGASEPFFDGWNKFGIQGSQLLPQFGDWITKMATRFDAWATKLSANGGINDMIMHGVHSLQAMWKIGGEVGNMFGAISRAAGLAGAGGLAEFEVNLSRLADRMNSEPWQSRAAVIFEGARAGASALNGGFKDLTTSLGNSAIWLGNVLDLLGQIGGESISRLSDVVSGKTYQEGVTAELTGMKTLIDNLSPAFVSLGDIIGNMGKVAGSVLSNLAPVINQIASLIDQVVSTLAVNLADVAPKMAATIGGVFRAITPLVLLVTNTINGLLAVIGKVPDSFVMVGVAAAAFFALRGLASKFYESMAGKSYFKNLESNWLKQQSEAGKTVTSFRNVNGELQKVTVPTERYSVMNAALADTRSRAGQLSGSIRDMNAAMRIDGASTLRANLETTRGVMAGGFTKAAGGLMSLMGGPWGLALAGAGLAIGAFAQQQTDAKAHVDDLTGSIDRQTGKLNQAGLEKIAKSWSDIGDAGDKWANFWRGSKAANESAELLKLNLSDVTKIIAEGGPKSDKLSSDLTNLGRAMRTMGEADATALGIGFEQMKGDVDDAAAAFGLTYDEITRMGLTYQDVEHLADNVRKEATAAALAKKAFEGLAEATGTTSVKAQILDGAMKNIADTSKDAASKIGDIKKALDILNDGGMSAREAEVNAAKVSQSAVQQAQAIREQLAGNQHLIDGTTGMIDVTSESGLKLQGIMSDSADSILIQARAAYEAAIEAKKTPLEAMEAAKQIIADGHGELQKIADAAGVDVALLEKDWAGFFGKDWTLTATFTASAKQFMAAREEVEAAGLTFDKKTYEAFLKANPDPTKITTDQAKQWATDYANGEYKAQLDAQNQPALMQILQATGQAENYKNGDYIAVMKALNSTNPGVQSAWQSIMNVTNGDYKAAIKAFLDAVSKANAEAAMAQLARTREVNMVVRYGVNGPRPEELANGGMFMNNVRTFANGGVMNALVKKFATGGIENHVAQIARPSSVYRVWAEPETGGEAYIPLAASKRQRSTQILNQVASQFGLKLTSAQQFANGGIVSRDRTGGAVNVTIGNYQTHASDTPDDVARALMRRVKTSGVYTPLEGF
jgi:hypothetical protein